MTIKLVLLFTTFMTSIEIFVIRQMVHGEVEKVLPEKMVTIQMDVSFVWSLILLCIFHQWQIAMITWCVHFYDCFLLKALRSLLTPKCMLAFMLNCLFFAKGELLQVSGAVVINNLLLSFWHFFHCMSFFSKTKGQYFIS